VLLQVVGDGKVEVQFLQYTGSCCDSFTLGSFKGDNSFHIRYCDGHSLNSSSSTCYDTKTEGVFPDTVVFSSSPNALGSTISNPLGFPFLGKWKVSE
jgi:hypothetical protein